MPILGTVIEDNVIKDALGGIQIGGEHGFTLNSTVNGTWSESTTGRVFVTAAVIGNVFEWDQTFLSLWENTYYAPAGNLLAVPGEPSESELLPTLTVGSG
jgi:hypothetical protein